MSSFDGLPATSTWTAMHSPAAVARTSVRLGQAAMRQSTACLVEAALRPGHDTVRDAKRSQPTGSPVSGGVGGVAVVAGWGQVRHEAPAL